MENKKIEVDGDEVYLKKDRFGWRVVHPVKNIDGSLNMKNFLIGGSYWNLLKVGIFVGIILFIIFAYLHDVSSCRELLECGARCPSNFLGGEFG